MTRRERVCMFAAAREQRRGGQNISNSARTRRSQASNRVARHLPAFNQAQSRVRDFWNLTTGGALADKS